MNGVSLLPWIVWTLLFLAAGLQFIVSAHQNIAREIGRIALLLHGSHEQWERQVQILHENLIPDDLRLTYLGYRATSGTVILGSFAAFGWFWAGLGALFLFFICPLVFSVTPHIMPRYFQRVLKNIKKYVKNNPMKIQQKIDGCSVSVNQINEVIRVGVAEKKNLGLWYTHLKHERIC